MLHRARRARRGELIAPEPRARDGHAPRADRARARHVARRVADDDQAACGARDAKRGGAALGAQAEDDVAVLVVAAEAAEREALEDAERGELRTRARADVARAEADRDAGASADGVEDVPGTAVKRQLD